MRLAASLFFLLARVVGSVVDARAPRLPDPVACERDAGVAKRWKGLGGASHAPWDDETRRRAKALLKKTPDVLEAPRVFVYPFPRVFANLSAVLADERGLSDDELAYLAGRADGGGGPYTFFELAHGATGGVAAATWVATPDGLAWTPGARATSAPAAAHAAGLAVHVGLGASARLVDDPNAADLFFIPHHENVPAPDAKAWPCGRRRAEAARRALGDVVRRAWDAHLRFFQPANKSYSFLQRNNGRDHFYGGNGPRRKSRTASGSAARALDAACVDAEKWTPWRQARVLRVESPDRVRRAVLREHPVPHVALKPPPPPARGARSRAAVVLARGAPDAWKRACERLAGCVEAPPGPYGLANATFALLPPGTTRAASVGIVEALRAGVIPVLARSPEAPEGRFKTYRPRGGRKLDPLSQRDVWPWHWPAQELTSLAVPDASVEDRLAPFLAAVSDDQVALMRGLIAKYAAYLRWPTAPKKAGAPYDALDVALHHLWKLAREDAARGRRVGLFLRRGRLDGDPCFPCPDFRPAPSPMFFDTLEPRNFVYEGAPTSPAQTSEWGY